MTKPHFSTRLIFIDTIRSIAILMMLEGHFITHSIQKIYRDDTNVIYAIWKFTRGLTAPVFLTISGLIFTYLLLKDKNYGFKNERLRKGFKRALLLIILGFLLQIKIYKVLFFGIPWFTELFYIFHVLHCIGTSILIIIGLYLLQNYIFKIPLGIIIALVGISVFLATPTLTEINYINIPRFIENILILSKDTTIKTSVFPLFPWAGFVFLGSSLGCLIYKYQHKNLGIRFAFILFIVGCLLHNYSYHILTYFQEKNVFSGITPFNYIYEFCRFGHVLIVISTIIFIESVYPYIKKSYSFETSKKANILSFIISIVLAALLALIPFESPFLIALPYLLFFIPIILALAKKVKWNQSLFHAIGQNTLFIFVLHVILLYEGFLGLQTGKYIKANLSPFSAILGMILFVFFFVVLIKNYDSIKNTCSGFIKQKPLFAFKKLNRN